MMSLTTINAQSQTNLSTKKVLVVYFSHSGNTRTIANYIKEMTGGDAVEIKPVNEYPKEYQAVVDQAEKEIFANYKPDIKTYIKNIDSYDVIFVGSPNWWNTIAPPVATFLSTHNLSGKTIIPFITHEGSRMGKSVSDIKKLCPNAKVLDGYACRGSNVGSARNEVAKWLKDIKLAK